MAEPATVWLTGFSGAGKTTIAKAAADLLRELGAPCCVLDGDELRRGLSSDLKLSREARREQARRAAHIAVILANNGIIPIVALISPYAEDRKRAREIHQTAQATFIEVWVDTPVDICIARDVKGLYANTMADSRRSGSRIESDESGMTGVAAPYEPPVNPGLRIDGYTEPPLSAASKIIATLGL